jgi:hypothetical protein
MIRAGNKAFNPHHVVMTEIFEEVLTEQDHSGAVKRWHAFQVTLSTGPTQQYRYETREECEQNYSVFLTGMDEMLFPPTAK